jgi:hypothetical protein
MLLPERLPLVDALEDLEHQQRVGRDHGPPDSLTMSGTEIEASSQISLMLWTTSRAYSSIE